jgi:hypothetical protein
VYKEHTPNTQHTRTRCVPVLRYTLHMYVSACLRGVPGRAPQRPDSARSSHSLTLTLRVLSHTHACV